jgi:hypothetical protein
LLLILGWEGRQVNEGASKIRKSEEENPRVLTQRSLRRRPQRALRNPGASEESLCHADES